MAYSTSRPPQLLVPSIGNRPALWSYDSTHGSTLIAAVAGFVTNALDLGMKLNDFVLISESTVVNFAIGKVTAITSTGCTIGIGSMTST